MNNFKIESDVPYQPARRKPKTQRIKPVIKRMKAGDSILVENATYSERQTWAKAFRELGIEYKSSKVSGGIRFWRMG